MRNSLTPRHIVRLAMYGPAQDLQLLEQAIDIADRDAEQDPATGSGSTLGVGDKAQFTVAHLEADIKGGPIVGHAGRRRGSEQPGVESQQAVEVRGQGELRLAALAERNRQRAAARHEQNAQDAARMI